MAVAPDSRQICWIDDVQLLLAQASYDRIAARLEPLCADVEIVTMTGPTAFSLRGQPIEAEDVDPALAWVSLDTIPNGVLPAILAKLAAADKTQWVQLFMAGLDNPIFKTILSRGVRLTKSNAQAIPVAEYVVGHGLALLLPIAAQADLQSRRTWGLTRYREIGETRWTLVGFGAVGREIAARIKPFGAQLTVVRRQRAAPTPGADLVIDQAALPTVLGQTDVLVLACPLTDETRGMAGAGLFAQLKPGAVLINVGRGGLVDEDALHAALDGGLSAAVLDVFATEPLPAEHWLWAHPKARISGHTAATGSGVIRRGDDLFLENLVRFLEGRPLLNEASKADVGL